MINFNLEIEKVHPINIKEIESNRYSIDDNIKKAIILYNSALGEMKKGNFNLVISDLKKALSYNKDFTEAIKLMGLCYVSMKEYKKAEKVFKSLNKYEIYDELVDEYLDSLSAKKSIYEIPMNAETVESLYKDRNVRIDATKVLNKKLATGLLVVVFVAAGVGINYIQPEIVQGVLAKYYSRVQGTEENLQAENENVNSNKDKNSDEEVLAEKNTTSNIAPDIVSEGTKANSENTKSREDNYKSETTKMLKEVEKALNTGSYENAANLLISMKNRNFDNETKSKFNDLWQSLKPNPLWTIYNDGNNLYKQQKYREALPKLIIASEFVPSAELMPWITYQIGMCYKETKDNSSARLYFNKVKDNYPKSEYLSYAKMMLSEIGN